MTTFDDGRGEPLYRFRSGALEVDPARGEVRIDAQRVALEPKPLALLLALIERPGQVVSRPELLQRLWGRQEHLSQNVLANAVLRLRRALGPELGPLVRNVAAQGYLFDAKVERHAIGRRFESRFALATGVPVPGRDGYVLDAPLGSSPHSEVWLARHTKTQHRRVFKFCSDGDRLAALKREYTLYRVLRESLGERDDYAQVLDANFAAPPFWLECAYGGDSLLAWAGSGGPLAAMPLPERLALFAGIARSVADAHRVGVLHKDLKPANVLVAAATDVAAAGSAQAPGAAPRCWVSRITDFGSGRLLSPEALQRLGVTQLGLTSTAAAGSDTGSGTLMYLAPELFAGEAPTVQSDLYALGLMLYQMVVGDLRRPMATGWEADIDDELLREDIAAATHGRPQERLKSVAEWVERLTTHAQRRALRHRAAALAQAAESAQAEVRRARARRPWLAALALVLAAGLGATSWAWRDAARQRALAAEASDRAEAIQAFLSDDVLGGANPFAAQSAEPQTVKAALLKAAQGVDSRFATHPEARAAVHAALAQLLQNHQEFGAANREWAKALPGLRLAHRPGDPRTLAAMYRAAVSLSRAGDVPGSDALLHEADAASALAPEPDPTVTVLRAFAHGSQRVHQGRPAEAVPFLQQALASARAAPGQVAMALRDACYDQLANAFYGAGRYKDGIAIASEWIEALRARKEEPALLLASARHRLAVSMMNDGRPEAARALLDQAIAAFETGLGPAAFDTLMARNDRCTSFESAGALEAAQACRETLLPTADAAPDLPSRIAASMRLNLGIGYFMLARDDDALRWLDDAIVRLRPLADGEALQQVARYYAACAEMRLGRVEAALARLAGLQLAVLGAPDPVAPWALRLQLLQGIGLAKRGELDAGRRLLEPAIAEMEKTETVQSEGVLGLAKLTLLQGGGEPKPQ